MEEYRFTLENGEEVVVLSPTPVSEDDFLSYARILCNYSSVCSKSLEDYKKSPENGT